ncbi:hypothetical protein B2H97_04850 [Paraclostridium bifermentans]|uniref:serine/threonine-protein kinase n=1 Tax=Paraclostridium bifermentans TaxID=1490 RepID=UPI000A1729BF|nr:serine/threonine-protein kinase [Paraclostridium bifermentans]OSB12427.1 hypothetical protein B2H97_04850 [Paraclostridium bifermentans]
MNIDEEYKLSLYEKLKSIHKSRKSEIFLVQNALDEKFYIKRVLKEYTLQVYESLTHIGSKNMAKIYEVFEHEDKLIIIEEFISGHTLQEILKREGNLSEDIVAKYMIDLCNVLKKIHNLNPCIIHRDIKPANIMISNDGVLKLIDFDIARVYKYGENMDTTLLGTKGYASPEQFGFDQTDCRSDIYAIGIMMNVLTTGKHTKEIESDGKLKDIIKKCTKISANERYQSVEDLKADLENLINSDNDIKYLNINMKKNNNLWDILPGFRSRNKLNMMLAILWYLFLITGLVFVDSTITFIGNVLVIGLLLSLFLLYTNFLNIKSKLPMIRSKERYFSIFGYIIYSFILFMIFGLGLELVK